MGRLRSFWSYREGSIPQGLAENTVLRFKNLSGVRKLVLVGLAGFVLLVLLSPVTFVSGVLFVLACVAVAVRQRVRKKPWRNSAVVATLALVPTLVAGGMSDAVYGTGFVGGSGGQSTEDGTAYVPSNPDNLIAGNDSNASGHEVTASDLSTSNFQVDQVQTAPLNDENGQLVVTGRAESLFEDDIEEIARHVGSQTGEYDLVKVDVFRETDPSELDSPEDFAALSGSCRSAHIDIANDATQAAIRGMAQGTFQAQCGQ